MSNTLWPGKRVKKENLYPFMGDDACSGLKRMDVRNVHYGLGGVQRNDWLMSSSGSKIGTDRSSSPRYCPDSQEPHRHRSVGTPCPGSLMRVETTDKAGKNVTLGAFKDEAPSWTREPGRLNTIGRQCLQYIDDVVCQLHSRSRTALPRGGKGSEVGQAGEADKAAMCKQATFQEVCERLRPRCRGPGPNRTRECKGMRS